MKNITLILLAAAFAGLIACSKTTPADVTYPEIYMGYDSAFPLNCDRLLIGESFVFSAHFEDNFQLGTFSLEIHNNFDHHTHSTNTESCVFDSIKTPVNPFLFIQEYAIPDELADFEARVAIEIPEGVDSGDYHFMIRLTDHAGWQTIKGISVKLEESPVDQE